MEAISVFDMLKIGIGPSSSHTLGPWRASERFIRELTDAGFFEQTCALKVQLYGSLALTGVGHGTDIAILLGLCGQDPVTVPVHLVQDIPFRIKDEKQLPISHDRLIPFDPDKDIEFLFSEVLPLHANGMRIKAFDGEGALLFTGTYYSIGGGFVVKDGDEQIVDHSSPKLPCPINSGVELAKYCQHFNLHISDIVLKNELAWRSKNEVYQGLLDIWQVMLDSIYNGCHREGILPGGLNVKRRAFKINKKLLADADYQNPSDWMQFIRNGQFDFSDTIKWIGCFAMAVNEENASFGRIVTAPTNGASGVIPAVLLYYLLFLNKQAGEEEIVRFLLVAGEIGSLFKKGSTISAAMGGCQAEIGVSSAMAAGALCERLGGDPGQVLQAAEIAMEHHLGLTCDPVGGLVQVPCIERNSMGAMKAITAAKIALESDPLDAKVSLDAVIKTMFQTAQDMNTKYKETSQGGLAANIAISIPEC